MCKELNKQFDKGYQKLSVRAKNVMDNMDLGTFEDFYGSFIEDKRKIDFSKARNCGKKTVRELNLFSISLLNAYAGNNPTFFSGSLTTRINLLYEKLFNELSPRAKNRLQKAQADDASSFISKLVINRVYTE